MEKVLDFIKRHLIITNIVIMVVVTMLLLWIVNRSLAVLTEHDKVCTVPDVRERTVAEARGILSSGNLQLNVIDSVYHEGVRPGAVVEQRPPAGSTVKMGGTVGVTVTAFNPPQIQLPALVGIPVRQARANLASLGFTDITEVRVASDYKDLVIAVKSLGVVLRPGTRLPVGSPIVIEVGEGYVPEPEPDSEFSLGYDTFDPLGEDEWDEAIENAEYDY